MEVSVFILLLPEPASSEQAITNVLFPKLTLENPPVPEYVSVHVPPLSVELKDQINEVQEMKDAGEVEIPQDVWDKVLEM